jgi:hypothetical protein
MPRNPSHASAFLLAGLLTAGCMFLCRPAQAQESGPPQADSKPEKPPDAKLERVIIHIEVTAGDKNVPVDSASVYVRYNEAHKIKADKLVEMNVKTNMEGKVRVPLVPKGKILIQVIAPNWKTFGRWFDLTDDEQVFKIHLDKPPKWY